MSHRAFLVAALAVGLSSAVQAQTAQVIPTCGSASALLGPGGSLYTDTTGVLCTSVGAGGGGGGASTVAGSQELDVRSTTGTLNAASTSSTLDFALNGQSTLGLRFSGLAASGATVSYFQSIDGGTTYTATAETNTGNGTLNTTRTADGQVRVNAAGRTNIRLQVTTAGTGTISVASNISVRPFGVAIDGPLPPGGNTIGLIGNSFLLDATFTGRINTLGQKTSAQSTPVVLPSDQTVPISGTVSALNLGVYNSTAPTVTSGAQTILQATANGSLFVDLSRSAAGPLATGAATAANQTTELTNLGTTTDTPYAGTGATTVLGALKGLYTAPTQVGQYNPSLPTLASGQTGYLATDVNGRMLLGSGTNQIGTVLLGGNTASFGSLGATANPGGLTNVLRVVSSAASTNAAQAKTTGGRLFKITGFNAAASVRWLHFYNTASAPTVGTTTVFFALPLPPGAFSFDAQDIGYYFSTGIAYSITTGAADSDATALTAGDILNMNVWYQ